MNSEQSRAERSLPAGRELDALVAEKVMGYLFEGLVERTRYWVKDEGRPHFNGQTRMVPHYSTDIAAAWQVVEKVMATYNKKIAIETYDGKIWSIKPCGTSSKSAPHAICLAALRAVGALK